MSRVPRQEAQVHSVLFEPPTVALTIATITHNPLRHLNKTCPTKGTKNKTSVIRAGSGGCSPAGDTLCFEH